MSAIKDVLSAVKEVLLLTNRVDTFGTTLTAIVKEVRNHDRRLVRLETMVEIAQKNRIPPRS
jgi:hypothetical protein